jgi:hypothetical protein
MGTGSTTEQNGSYRGSNALWVFNGWGTRPPAPEWVSWPPPGFVPYQLVYARWSFSRANADFTGTTIEMTRDGTPVALAKKTVVNGYGDNTVVWEPDPARLPGSTAPEEDITYIVILQNVVIGGLPQQFSYTVTAIDPDKEVPTGLAGDRWQSYR